MDHDGEVEAVEGSAFSHDHLAAVGFLGGSAEHLQFPRDFRHDGRKSRRGEKRHGAVNIMSAAVPEPFQRIVFHHQRRFSARAAAFQNALIGCFNVPRRQFHGKSALFQKIPVMLHRAALFAADFRMSRFPVADFEGRRRLAFDFCFCFFPKIISFH